MVQSPSSGLFAKFAFAAIVLGIILSLSCDPCFLPMAVMAVIASLWVINNVDRSVMEHNTHGRRRKKCN